MQKVIHKADSRGFIDHGWLQSHFSFSFAEYYNPEKVHFGKLRVLNDDIIKPGMGFGMHPHDNMEIITIPIKGSLTHKDSEGNEFVINKNDVQIMSAGSGIVHSEYNNSQDEVNLLQIWVFPKERNIKPRYQQKTFSEINKINKLQTVVSPIKSEEFLWINQDAYFSLSKIDKGITLNYKTHNSNNGVYFFVIDGNITIENETLNYKDAMGIYNTDNFIFQANSNSEILLMEIPMI